MWQRKQTIFLALCGSLMVLAIFFQAWVATIGESRLEVFPLHFTVTTAGEKATTYYPFAISAILAAAAATLAFSEIGRYENRMTQLKMGALNALVMAGAMGSEVYFVIQQIETNQVAGQYGFSLWFMAAALVCNMIANRFIRRDEKLVRDADRLR